MYTTNSKKSHVFKKNQHLKKMYFGNLLEYLFKKVDILHIWSLLTVAMQSTQFYFLFRPLKYICHLVLHIMGSIQLWLKATISRHFNFRKKDTFSTENKTRKDLPLNIAKEKIPKGKVIVYQRDTIMTLKW